MLFCPKRMFNSTFLENISVQSEVWTMPSAKKLKPSKNRRLKICKLKKQKQLKFNQTMTFNWNFIYSSVAYYKNQKALCKGNGSMVQVEGYEQWNFSKNLLIKIHK